MKKLFNQFALLLFFTPFVLAQDLDFFNEYFIDETMRIDYYHIGNSEEEMIKIDQIYKYGIWAGSRKYLIDDLNLGRNSCFRQEFIWNDGCGPGDQPPAVTLADADLERREQHPLVEPHRSSRTGPQVPRPPVAGRGRRDRAASSRRRETRGPRSSSRPVECA